MSLPVTLHDLWFVTLCWEEVCYDRELLRALSVASLGSERLLWLHVRPRSACFLMLAPGPETCPCVWCVDVLCVSVLLPDMLPPLLCIEVTALQCGIFPVKPCILSLFLDKRICLLMKRTVSWMNWWFGFELPLWESKACFYGTCSRASPPSSFHSVIDPFYHRVEL